MHLDAHARRVKVNLDSPLRIPHISPVDIPGVSRDESHLKPDLKLFCSGRIPQGTLVNIMAEEGVNLNVQSIYRH